MIFRKKVMVDPVDRQTVLDHFKTTPVTISNIIQFARKVFESRGRNRKNLLSTALLTRIVRFVCTVSNAPEQIRNSIHFQLYDVMAEYRILGGQRTKPAELKSPYKIRKLIQRLWYNLKTDAKRPKFLSLEKTIRRRMASLITLFCSVSGRRWVDITRLRWDHMEFHKLPHGNFVKFHINISKGNVIGRRNESIALAQDDSLLCPVKLLVRYWILMGRPLVGFVFPCRHKKRKLKKRFYTSGRAYCCPGHKRGTKTVECLGSVDPIMSYGIMARIALKLGFRKPPTKHTFRRLLCVMANKLGFTRDRICEQFGWKHDSGMPHHYLMDDFNTSKDALPFSIAETVKKDDSFSFMNDIPIRD